METRHLYWILTGPSFAVQVAFWQEQLEKKGHQNVGFFKF
jgi:hypothetical protein